MESKHKLKHRFDIVRKLGQGTYGKVQLAINKETGQEVAIKTIRKSKIENEQDAVRIRREIQIMSSIRHPNIVHIYEVFENKDKIVLVMQNASGGELYEYLSERKVLSDGEARRIFRQVVAAVYYIHKNKICHRDLKLENILLDEKGNAKIADFGLSNVYDEKGLLSTFCGSPLYASPEIVKGLPYFGPEVDCWSLGVLLYTLVYGAMPFDGSNFKKLVKQISNGDYYEPKQRAAASGLIRHLLTVKASERASIIDVCKNDWVNESYDTQLLQVAEDLANLSPVRLDLLIALQPQTGAAAAAATTHAEQQQQHTNSDAGGFQMVPGSPATSSETVPPVQSPCESLMRNLPPEQVVPCASLMRMPSMSVKNSSSLGTLNSSSSATSMKSLAHAEVCISDHIGGVEYPPPSIPTTTIGGGGSCDIANQGGAVQRTSSGGVSTRTTTTTMENPSSTSMASIELKSKNAESGIPTLPTMQTLSKTSAGSAPPVCSGIPCRVIEEQRGLPSASQDSPQDVHIISRKTENPKSFTNHENVEESLRSLVWPAAADPPPPPQTLKSASGRLSPESGGGAPDDDDMKGEVVDVNENTVPRGLPMKSYKKFTFERNGGHVVVREKICQKEERDGNKKIVIEKRVTSRTSSFDGPSTTPPIPTESTAKTTRRDDSSDEEDFDIHFDSSHGPLGLLNVMKFMDADFRTRWQNHPIFQNLSRRPLGSIPPSSSSSSVQSLQNHRRLHSPSLMKMFMDRDSGDETRSLFDRRPPLGHEFQAFTTMLSDPAAAAKSERKLSRGSSLDRSSFRAATRMTSVPQPPPQSQVDPMSAAAYDGLVGSARNIPRYSRTVSDRTIGGEPQPSILRTRTQNSTSRPGILHMELNFNTRHPASFGLMHSWSNHGLWQQQQQQQGQPHQSTSSTPSRIEMRVHYSTPSSPPPPPPPSSTPPPIGMPPKPPKSEKEPRPGGQIRTERERQEESVSDRINRRSYYHRFSSVDSQKRPTSTIWDQQSGGHSAMSAGAGALWEAASPDKPLGAPPRASSMVTTTTTATKPSSSSSTHERASSTSM